MEKEVVPAAKVVDFKSFKDKRSVEREIGRGRKPLYVNHAAGTISGRKDENADFGDRLTKIRSSLDRINQLMTELKKLSQRPTH